MQDRLRPSPVDEQVRNVLEPETESVSRIVENALAPNRGRRSASLLTAGALAALLVLVMTVRTRNSTVNPDEHGFPTAQISNVGRVITVRTASGSAWVIANAGQAPTSKKLFIIQGEIE